MAKLEDFAAQCKTMLKAKPGNDGRQDVAAALQDVLKDEAFVSQHLGDDTGARKVLYEDPDLGFTILAHRREGPTRLIRIEGMNMDRVKRLSYEAV